MKKQRLLLYNAFPRVYSTMGEATNDLQRISRMGFNAVWLNPLNSTSGQTVRRYNFESYEQNDVTGSLYAAYDYSVLNHRLFPDLIDPNESKLNRNGNPGFASEREKNLLFAYTETARNNGLVPLFDLVLNHIAKDSPLVVNKSPHFQALGIDTAKWFKIDLAHHWDDIAPFNYEAPLIRNQIIEHFWLPILTKYVNDFGFMGIRVDFATGLSPELQRELFPKLVELVQTKFNVSPIIFAECLPPKGLEKIAQDYRGLYTHVTNNANWTMASSGHDIGVKQQLIHLDSKGAELKRGGGGTIGFAASHDDGPASWNAMEGLIEKKIEGDNFLRHLNNEKKKDKKDHQTFFLRITHETLTKMVAYADVANIEFTESELADRNNAVEMKTMWLQTMKQRIATVALLSDGGYYLMSGDEFSDITPKSVFENHDGTSIYHESKQFSDLVYVHRQGELSTDFSKFITDLNEMVIRLSPAIFPHWSKVIDINPDLVIVISYNGAGFSNPELAIINIGEKKIEITEDLIHQIALKHCKDENNNHDAFSAIKNAKLFYVGNFTDQLPHQKQTHPGQSWVNQKSLHQSQAEFEREPSEVPLVPPNWAGQAKGQTESKGVKPQGENTKLEKK